MLPSVKPEIDSRRMVQPLLTGLGLTAEPRWPEEPTGALDGLRSRQLQNRACQTTVGKSKFIENREVVRLDDRN